MTRRYSSLSAPQTLTMTAVSYFLSSGRTSAAKCSTPTPCRPMALIRPEAVSTSRGGGFPSRGP